MNREAIINAIAHRDYSKDGAKVQLEVFPDRIVVKRGSLHSTAESPVRCPKNLS